MSEKEDLAKLLASSREETARLEMKIKELEDRNRAKDVSRICRGISNHSEHILTEEANRLVRVIKFMNKNNSGNRIFLNIDKRYHRDLLQVMRTLIPKTSFSIYHEDDPGQSYSGADSTGDYLQWFGKMT